MGLLTTLRPGGAQSTDSCAINAFIALFYEAAAADALPALAARMRRFVARSLARPSPPNSERVTVGTLAKAVEESLTWWARYYQHQEYERRFLEYQSGLPFQSIEEFVAHLKATLPGLLDPSRE